VLGGALKDLKDAIDPGRKTDPSNPAASQAPPSASSSSVSRVDIRA
jgi:hypothetical protein